MRPEFMSLKLEGTDVRLEKWDPILNVANRIATFPSATLRIVIARHRARNASAAHRRRATLHGNRREGVDGRVQGAGSIPPGEPPMADERRPHRSDSRAEVADSSGEKKAIAFSFSAALCRGILLALLFVLRATPPLSLSLSFEHNVDFYDLDAKSRPSFQEQPLMRARRKLGARHVFAGERERERRSGPCEKV